MPESGSPPSPLLAALIRMTLDAGSAVMGVYTGEVHASLKPDCTPVTAADLVSERILLDRLRSAAPDLPVLSEEAVAAGVVPAPARRFFLVDPLDGTKEFLSRNGEFTINVALIEQDRPQAGVVYAPALGRLFWGEADCGAGEARIKPGEDPDRARWRALRVRPRPAKGLVVVVSRSHRDDETDAYLATIDVAALLVAGSSLKFCLIAAGEADLYPRFGRTMEWDTAAGHAVLQAAGGTVTTAGGSPLTYGKKEQGYANPAFLARGG